MLATITLFCLTLSVFGTPLDVQLPTSCGKANINVLDTDWRIVGGKDAGVGEFPWQTVLTRVFDDEQTGQKMMELCGGSIINKNFILTAAHCVAHSSIASEYNIYLGVHDIPDGGDIEGIAMKVEKVIHHAEFDSSIIKNDVALVKLSEPIDFEEHKDLEPICLATSDTEIDKNCVVSGFGYLNAQGKQTKTLQKVLEPLTDESNCERVHKTFDPQQQVCAGGSEEGGTGACMGDSGGPLQCKSTDGKWYQTGIVSYGIPCARPNDPDVFTSVAHFLDWIKTTISENQ